MTFDLDQADAIATATAVRNQEVSAETVVKAALDRIAAQNDRLNCFTAVIAEQALASASNVDAAIAAGTDPGIFAGVPFAVKNLFDISGLTTLAGSKINQENPPAIEDAAAVAALRQAGAVLVGALNMDEYAYGFMTKNSHYGEVHNPHDLKRLAGGSSGGSAAAVAARLVPLTLGTDTNGSVRVPAAFCGVLGLKPTYGRLSRRGVYPFAGSLDHVGAFARSVRDVAAAFDMLQGADPRDPVCTTRSPERCLPAQRFRRWYRDRVHELFQQVDLILAPTAPCVAPLIGQQTMRIDGEEVLIRPNLGLYTQPLSFIGLPALSVPVQRLHGLPLGVQIIAAPYQEALILRVAAFLEAKGVVSIPAIATQEQPV